MLFNLERIVFTLVLIFSVLTVIFNKLEYGSQKENNNHKAAIKHTFHYAHISVFKKFFLI